MPNASNREEWKKIAEEITQETDPKKMNELVREHCDTLDRSKAAKDQSAVTECGFQVDNARCRGDAGSCRVP